MKVIDKVERYFSQFIKSYMIDDTEMLECFFYNPTSSKFQSDTVTSFEDFGYLKNLRWSESGRLFEFSLTDKGIEITKIVNSFRKL